MGGGPAHSVDYLTRSYRICQTQSSNLHLAVAIYRIRRCCTRQTGVEWANPDAAPVCCAVCIPSRPAEPLPGRAPMLVLLAAESLLHLHAARVVLVAGVFLYCRGHPLAELETLPQCPFAHWPPFKLKANPPNELEDGPLVSGVDSVALRA